MKDGINEKEAAFIIDSTCVLATILISGLLITLLGPLA